MAKPVVGARIGQVAELIDDGKTGLLYRPGDASDLARCLRAIFAMPDRGARMGIAAREQVAERHTWERNAERIVALARSLAGSREVLTWSTS